MAAITSAKTGNWNDTATWVGGVIPVIEDTVTIADGHTVTVPSGYTAVCGLSGTITATDYAIRTTGDNGTGVLVVASGGTLEVYSHLRQGNVTWTINGTILAAHTTTRLNWQIGTRGTAPWARLVVEGTGKGARARVGKTAGGVGFAQLGGPTGFAGRGQMTTRWAKFEHVGAATANFNDAVYVTGYHNIHENTWWDNCAEVNYASLTAGASLTIERCAITNPVHASARNLILSTAVNADVGVTRRLVDCAFEGTLRFFPTTAGLDMKFVVDNVQLGGYSTVALNMNIGTDAAGSGYQASISRLLLFQDNFTDRCTVGTPSTGVLLKVVAVYQSSTNNPNQDAVHMVPSASMAIEDSWAEVHPGWNTGTGAGSTTNGGDDAFVFNNTTVADEFTVRRCISATNDMGLKSGSILTVGGGTSWQTGKRFFVDRCTMPNGDGFSAEHGTPTLGTGSTPMATITGSILSNPASAASEFFGTTTSTWSALPDGLLAASGNAQHNVSGNPYDGTVGNPITAAKYNPSGIPTSAVSADPQYVDPTRTFLKWGRTVLGNPSLNDRKTIFQEFVKRYTDDTWNTAITFDAMHAWLFEGYRPQNAAYQVGGQWIGAVEGVATSSAKAHHKKAAFLRFIRCA